MLTSDGFFGFIMLEINGSRLVARAPKPELWHECMRRLYVSRFEHLAHSKKGLLGSRDSNVATYNLGYATRILRIQEGFRERCPGTQPEHRSKRRWIMKSAALRLRSGRRLVWQVIAFVVIAIAIATFAWPIVTRFSE